MAESARACENLELCPAPPRNPQASLELAEKVEAVQECDETSYLTVASFEAANDRHERHINGP
jgi:hypothetical protein